MRFKQKKEEAMTIRVAINGFGRIGRDVVRGIFERDHVDFDLVCINWRGKNTKQPATDGGHHDADDLKKMAHLLKYDTVYRRFEKEVDIWEDGLVIDGKKIRVTDRDDPKDLPWKDLKVDLVIDSTGAFNTREGGEKHLAAGAKKVVFTAPVKGEDITIVMGVNDQDYDSAKHDIISNASCTTNCLAPITKVILDEFGIERGLMTTVHAYTNDQNIQDNRHKKDMRRARAGAENIIPTTTGAAKAVGKVIPEVEGKLTGFALRVPVPTGSIVDVTFELSREASVEEINKAIKDASENAYKGIIAYTDEPIVSSDIIKDPCSSIFDSELTLVKDRLVKLVSWYDNEWGYSQRVIDLTEKVANSL